MSRWYWFVETCKLLLFNTFCNEPQARNWCITEDRLERYQKLEKELKATKAECEMWFTISQMYKNKLEDVIYYLNSTGGKIEK